MTGRTFARVLAPAALVVAAVALFSIFASGRGDSASEPASSSAKPEATATADSKRGKPAKEGEDAPSGEPYTVEPGDTPNGIAAKLEVDPEALLEANPGVDANALTVGEELNVP